MVNITKNGNRINLKLTAILAIIAMLLTEQFCITSYAAIGDLGEPRSSFNMGSAKMLGGDNTIVSMFVDTPNGRWNDNEKEATLRALGIATDYIIAQARLYDQEVSFNYDWSGDSNLKCSARLFRKPDDSEEFADYLDQYIALWKEYHLRKDAYSGMYNNEFSDGYERLISLYDSDNIFMMVFLKCEGRAYAICYDGIDSPEESLVAYIGSAPSVLAHEILHLYGAHDLYEKAEYTDDAVTYIKDKYPKDIMLTIERGNAIHEVIDPLTAYHIGWIDECPDTDIFEQLKR